MYLWEGCRAEVESTKRASVLALLLSVAMVACGASPTYHGCFNDSNLPGKYCLFLTVQQTIGLFGLGLSLCSALYWASSYFERILADRRARWEYLGSTLRDKVSRE